jgi:NitT/TauT family transport system substrate-binding protein
LSSSDVSSEQTHRRRRGRGIRLRYPLATVAVAALALVTACSSSSSGGSSTTSSNGQGSGKLTTLSVDAAFFGPVDVPMYLAQAKGYFKQEGLTLKFITASSNTQLASVLGGSVQFASTSALNTIKSGAQFVNFMPVEIGYSEDVVMSKSAYQAAGLSASSSVKQKIEALAGKKLGVISATGENAIIFKYMFKYAGVPSSELHMVQLGTPAAILAALKQGTIQGANVGSPYPAEAVSDGYAEYLFHAPLSDIPPMSKAITQTLATTTSYYNGNKATIKKFLTAYQKGINAMNQNPDAAAEFVAKKYFASQPLAAFMSSFKEDLPVIAKTTSISAAQKDALKTIASGAGQTVPSNWDSFFVQP